MMIVKIASALSVALPMTLDGQYYRGKIGGRILDPAGGSIAGAAVSLVNAVSSATMSARSDSNGNYIVLYVIPGLYTITVEAAGFKRLVRNGIEIRVGEHLPLDLRMEIIASREVISRATGEESNKSSTSSASEILDQTAIAGLPPATGIADHRRWIVRGRRTMPGPTAERRRIYALWLACRSRRATVNSSKLNRHISKPVATSTGSLALEATANDLDGCNVIGLQSKEI